jgi:PhoH-like ATPase
MEKTYIVDTNVLVHDPRALFKFEDNELIVPIYVLEEIDRFKRDTTERGRTAREVAR